VTSEHQKKVCHSSLSVSGLAALRSLAVGIVGASGSRRLVEVADNRKSVESIEKSDTVEDVSES
jgi:hypothetical protein